MAISDTSHMIDVYHYFTGVGIWASLGKAGITKIAYDFRRDLRTAQLCTTALADKRSIDDGQYRD